MISRLVVLAGSGDYPRLIIEGAKKAGVKEVDVLAFKGSTSRATCKAADKVKWFTLSNLIEGAHWVAAQHYDGGIFAGQINPLSLFTCKFEPKIMEMLNELPVKCAHTVFQRIIDYMVGLGFKPLPASLYMDDNLPGLGPLTQRGLSVAEERDLVRAIQVAKDMGVHDVGQTVMVKGGMVLAVEAFEGTNAAIKRGGKLGNGSIVYKAAREGHDMRFDIPVVGLKTLKVMKRAKATALIFQAGRLIMLDKPQVIEYANKHNIAIVGIDSGLPAAPLRV